MLRLSPRWCLALVAATLLATACRDQPAAPTTAPTAGEVILYTALDRQFSEPILVGFTAQTGIKVLAVYDTESTKTVGLVNRIRAEANRPRCDVFWNNEILNTLRLKSEGLLQRCDPPQAQDYPSQFRDADGCWYGFAARARVLIVNTNLVLPGEMPTSVRDLADPKWRGRTGIAKPLFGTTASHVACLFALLGDEPAKGLLASFKANDLRIEQGNKACAEMVGRGELVFALTDTDDAIIEVEAGRPVKIVFPDAVGPPGTPASQPADDQPRAPGKPVSPDPPGKPPTPEPLGTMVLPNTLAMVKGAPHPDAAARLIDYLLSPEVEASLATGPSAQIPLNRRTRAASRVGRLTDIRPMPVDFAAAAERFSTAAAYIEKEFLE